MAVSKTVTVTCDYPGCKSSTGNPAVLQWNETEVNAGRQQAPEEAQYLVLISRNGVNLSFCCQLHAAEFFLPPGYEAKQKEVIQLPKKKAEKKTTLPWLVKPAEADERRVISRSEIGPVPQPDGDSGTDDLGGDAA